MLTGTASFVYEIAWIRMLSLVLGSSTQAFELMLSAFILGLALGGLWIRRRADRLKEPIRFLAGIQIAMGAMAVATLPVYGSTFRAMRWLVGTLPKTSMGYLEFNIASQGIAMLVMLPATFLAGTTLPLLTLTLVRAGRGESSIGAVYAANTLGAIAGVIAAVHVGLPLLGLKSLIVAGAAIDIGLGLLLLWVFRKKVQEPVWMAAAATAWLGLIVAAVDLDPRLMSSGVFRVNQKALGAEEIVLFHHDGKTATVDVTEDGSVVAIRTNGKIDATVNMVPSSPTVDELTQVLIAALPLLFHPKPSLVANIGLGSGMTTHVLLSDARIESLDTVEIEQGMVAGAMRFRPVNERAFSDPRSHIVIDDAKTFFSMQRKQYDVIVSEPSNPWVSGTASLFSTEFYRLVRHSLAPRGLFLQWLQLYEFDIGLVASVLKSLGDHFDDYVIYTAAPGDVVIIAVSEGLVPDHSGDLRLNTALGRELSRIWIRSEQDLMIRKIGDKRLLQPWVTASPIQPHSDYRPVLDHGAARARFVNRDASELLSLALGALPVAEMFGTSPRPWPSTHVTYSPHFAPDLYVALRLHDSLTARSPVHGASGAAPDADRMAMSARLLQDCASAGDERRRRLNIDQLAFRLANYLRPEEIERVWPAVLSLPCALSANGTEREWLALLRAVGQRDAEAMAASAERLLSQASSMDDTERRAYVLSAGMLGHLASGRPERAQALAVMKKEPRPSKRLAFTASVLEAHANASSAQDRRGWRITSGANALPAHSR
jgi:predicted membrane-bound spermidine synthase